MKILLFLLVKLIHRNLSTRVPWGTIFSRLELVRLVVFFIMMNKDYSMLLRKVKSKKRV